MYQGKHISVVIPAQNEEKAIGHVVSELRALTVKNNGNQRIEPLIDEIVVCDNGSTDNTPETALSAGADKVVPQPVPGYGLACLTAIDQLKETDIVLFVDGDHAFYASEAEPLIDAVAKGVDLAIGSRTLGHQEAGALTFPQQFGNWLASWLIRGFWQQPVTDLGPFRAISRRALDRLNMADQSFGWTVEMQVKAIQMNMMICEVPVATRRRIGTSKISGTVSGTIGAAKGILGMIFRLWWQDKQKRHRVSPHFH